MHVKNLIILMVVITYQLFPIEVAAISDDKHTCDQAIEKVAKNSPVPKEILYKIARLESGRAFDGKLYSWPWSLNNAGRGYFLRSKAKAISQLNELIGQGETNIDVGCMQLNIQWHAKHFENFVDMISPVRNVEYASSYLEELYKETGSWEKSVKYYHSRTPKYYSAYYKKFLKMDVPSKTETGFGNTSSSIFAWNFPNEKSNSTKFTGKPSSIIWVEPNSSPLWTYKNSPELKQFDNVKNFKMPALIKM